MFHIRLSHFYKLGLAFPQGPDDLSLCSTAVNGKEGDKNQGVYSIIRFIEKFSVAITCACVGKNPTGKDIDGLRYIRDIPKHSCPEHWEVVPGGWELLHYQGPTLKPQPHPGSPGPLCTGSLEPRL